VKLLRNGGIEVVGKSPMQCHWSLEELSQYSAVLLENVPASQIGMSGMGNGWRLWVEESWRRFFAMTGGSKILRAGRLF